MKCACASADCAPLSTMILKAMQLMGSCSKQLLVRVQNVIEKIVMLSVVIEASKKSVMFLCTPFANSFFYITHPVQIHLIGIHLDRSVRTKEVKFI